MPFQVSPGVNVSEIDLSTVVPAVSTAIGGFAGHFRWGPVEEVTLIGNQDQLAQVFGSPTGASSANTVESFFTCANFLDYANALQVVRGTEGNNATSGTAGFVIKNKNHHDTLESLNSDVELYYARYPGVRGNTLHVDTHVANDTTWANWLYKDSFSAMPGTSAYTDLRGGSNDEIHVVVSDTIAGDFSGVANSILEVFPFLSQGRDAKDAGGNDNYWKSVINSQSQYIYVGADEKLETSSGNTVTGFDFGIASANSANTLVHGSDGVDSDGNVTDGLDLLGDADVVDVSLIMTGGYGVTIQQHAIDNVSLKRLDAVTFLSPTKANVVKAVPTAAGVVTDKESVSRDTSYAFMDSGWKYQYDKYGDVYRWIPLNGDMAGLCARTEQQRDAWWSPAGYNRGQLKNVVKLAYNPSKTDRDALYKASVNPVATFKGSGTMLFGDKTLQTRPSSFDRINVRRLFIVMEKAISTAAKFSLFEFNDEFTRAAFRNMVEPFLRDIQGRRGIHDFRVVCDETNNTPSVIDRNEFIGDIFVKPARSINFIQLNFVAVSTGVDFSEVVGAV
jgi:phage tail sheath protein FI